ncbi:MAG: riboflavin biosynthesis protein RibF [Clostridia bacterium]|nr:riboflavin biosynthesis protein RibF [Clostridia bacterium]
MTVYNLKTMQICDITENTVLALGTFDGCHEGHRAVFGSAIRLAMKMRAKSGIYTFSSIPNTDTGSKKSIFTTEEKIKFMQRTGADYLIVEDFDAVKNISGEDFVREILCKKLHCVGASCGYDYQFGKGASCNAEKLSELFEKVGGCVDICPPITYNGVPICSTSIRKAIEDGECEKILPYSDPYSIYTIVEHGKELGRKMGTPTINQTLPTEKVAPKRGVYITECEIGEDVYPSVTNVGARPTTDGDNAPENMETHIIGYEGNLYSSYIKVNFYKFLRGEIKFGSIEELKVQIAKDCQMARDYFLK